MVRIYFTKSYQKGLLEDLIRKYAPDSQVIFTDRKGRNRQMHVLIFCSDSQGQKILKDYERYMKIRKEERQQAFEERRRKKELERRRSLWAKW